MGKRLISKDNVFENALQWIDNAFDLQKRKIMLSADVAEAPISRIIRAIHKMIEIDNESPIDIYINSYGGSVHEGLALYDTLEACPVQIRTHALGKVCSMGFIVYLAGDVRYSSARARFMHHETNIESEDSASIARIKDDIKEYDRLDDILNGIVENNTNKNNKWWLSKINGKDFWFGRAEAREYGVVTASYTEED